MRTHFHSRPEDLLAGIGPSIGADHYGVGGDVLDALHAAFGAEAGDWISRRDGATHLDLWKANTHVLRRAGVEKIELAGLCTACRTEDWFSHRAEHGRTGRFAALMWLEE
jgi:copper oxidase (laccase) domain-containing protein